MIRRRLTPCLLWLGVALGSWVSFRYAFTTWYAESDAAEAYVLWTGVRQQGWGFLRTFHYAPDNWLLWPMPAFALAFSVAGDAPWVTFAVGWLLFVGVVAAAFLVLRQVTGRVAAALASIVLLLSSRAAIGEAGFLTYPLSHNATLLLGLLAVARALAWIRTGRVGGLLLCGLLLLVAGVSDPWIEVAVTLPLGGAALLLALQHTRMARRTGLGLGLAIALALLGGHSHLFGLLPFLPSTPAYFSPAPGAAAWLATYAANWFGFRPHLDARYARLPGTVDIAVDLALLIGGIAGATVAALRTPARTPGLDALAVVAAGSTVLTCAAYVVLDLPGALSSGRFFMAAYVFGVILFAASLGNAWPALGRTGRAATAVYAILLPVAGLASAPASWLAVGLHTPFSNIPVFDKGAAAFAGFLRQHGLHYGYGSYWADEASTVGWLTHGDVVMHPMAFYPNGRPYPFYTQVSPSWYTDRDEPDRPQRSFLALTHEFDGCPDIAACEREAAASFGPPSERLIYEATVVLVWDHRLFGR